MELMPSSAAKPEEASAIHHLRMEWEPYKSIAEPTLCPNDCGRFFYPKGSGVFLNCGEICSLPHLNRVAKSF